LFLKQTYPQVQVFFTLTQHKPDTQPNLPWH
jgi:hypothetical protein